MGAVVLMRDGKLLYARGTGFVDVARAAPFAPFSASDGGSLAKTLTAAAVWRLAHEGRRRLDTAVTAYLPDYPYSGTLVRHLIEHSNGLLPYYEAFDPYVRPGQVRQTQDLLAIVRREFPQPRFAPGTRFEYSNLGFDAAVLIVERITGKPIADVFDEWFFTPLQMDSTFVRPGRFADFPGLRTLGYRWADSTWQPWEIYDNDAVIGGSGVYFSAMDLARWASAFAEGRAVAPEVLAKGQQSPIIGGRPSAITGLSWYCDDARARCQYGGVYNAFFSLAYWDRTRREAVAIATNSSIPPWSWITLQRDLVAALAGEPPSPPLPALVAVAPDSIAQLVGRYAAADHDTVSVSLQRRQLSLRHGDGLAYEMFHVAPDAFYVPGLDWFVGLSRGTDRQRLVARSLFGDFRATAPSRPPTASPCASACTPSRQGTPIASP